MQPNPVGWFEIYVEDMPRAKAFYEAVLQCELVNLANPSTESYPGLEMWGFPNSDMSGYGASGTLAKMPGWSGGVGGTLVYFMCDDCAVEAARAALHGGSIFKEKMSIGEHGFIALVIDTEGNMIGLHSCNQCSPD